MTTDITPTSTVVTPTIDKEEVVRCIREQLALDEVVHARAKELGCEDTYTPRSNREILWDIFSEQVANHVGKYTVPQYGDFPDDQLAEFSEADIKTNINRYIRRMGTNARGEIEEVRDMFKICHYISELYVRKIGLADVLKEELGKAKATLEAVKVTEVEDAA